MPRRLGCPYATGLAHVLTHAIPGAHVTTSCAVLYTAVPKTDTLLAGRYREVPENKKTCRVEFRLLPL